MNILIAEDHPLYRDALNMMVQQLDYEEITTELMNSYEEVIEYLKNDDKPDLMLVDLNMPSTNVWQGIRSIRELAPTIPLVVISSSESSEDSKRALEYGARGFIPKSLDSDSIRDALQLVIKDGVTIAPLISNPVLQNSSTIPMLTNRQKDVLQRLAYGDSNKMIANTLGLSEGTIKLHVRAVFNALNVHNRTQAVISAEKHGLIDPNKL